MCRGRLTRFLLRIILNILYYNDHRSMSKTPKKKLYCMIKKEYPKSNLKFCAFHGIDEFGLSDSSSHLSALFLFCYFNAFSQHINHYSEHYSMENWMATIFIILRLVLNLKADLNILIKKQKIMIREHTSKMTVFPIFTKWNNLANFSQRNLCKIIQSFITRIISHILFICLFFVNK